MAGSLAVIPYGQPQETVIAAPQDQWQVFFSRFITFPSLPSTCPSLVHPRNRCHRRTGGTWISTSYPTASLKLLRHHRSSSDAAVLSVCFQGRVLEEHYVSKLHFSWPQMACIAGIPARGSRAVFVSYKDSFGEIQKFALRFSAVNETETFMKTLKEVLKDPAETETMNSDFQSEVSSSFALMSSNTEPSRDCFEDLSNMTPVQLYSPQLPLSLNYEVDQEPSTRETILSHSYKGISPALPPSFASLLNNCCSEASQAAAQPSVPKEMDLKSQIARYMQDSSFQDMLVKVERVISEIEDDLML